MKTLYFECNMGAAGDMLMASLLELSDDLEGFFGRLNGAGIPGVKVTSELAVKHGITGTHVKVEINGHEEHDHEHHGHDGEHSSGERGHHHNSYHHIEHLIGHLNVSDNVKRDAVEVYKLIAEAESHAHGVPVAKIHFHEVGEMDAVADIVGVCMLIDEIAPDLILASPVNVGSGQVRCAHGVLPVPAPATAHIFSGVPIYNDDIKGELCTPTGAALLKYFVKKFDSMPVMSVAKIGYGMGKKDFEKANCVRAYVGDVQVGEDSGNEEVLELVCNLDDMTPEAVAFAQQLLLDEGALDVYITPIVMKKGRAGVMFSCMCRRGDKDRMVELIFKHTTTIGVREIVCNRYVLQREQSEVKTKFGGVGVKTAYGFGVRKSKLEYDDVSGIARDRGVSLQEVCCGVTANELTE